MRAFILAGGFATRLWPLTEKRAKPLLPLAGKPLLTHLVEKIPEEMPVTVSTNAVFCQDFHHWKSQIPNPKSQITILIEDTGHEDEKLGALGAVAQWINGEGIDEDVLLLAGDNYVGFSIGTFLKRFSGKPLIATHDIRDREAAKKFGIVVAESGPNPTTGAHRVTAFQEKPEMPGSSLVSTGCTVLPAETLPSLIGYASKHPDNVGGVFEHLLTTGHVVECVSFEDPWFDIGSFEAYLEATRALVGNDVRRGAECRAPAGESESGNIFEGSIVIGNRSTVERSTLRNTVVFEDCRIENCHLEKCIVDNGCVLKGVDLMGKMLREGTRLMLD